MKRSMLGLIGLAAMMLIVALAACSSAPPKPVTTAIPVAEAAPPTARQIIDRFVEATGGAQRLLQLESRATVGTFAVPAQGLEGAMKTWAKAPDKLATQVDIPGLGEIRGGYDGAVAWALNPMMGAQVLADESLLQMRDQANFHTMLYRPEDFTSLTLKGETDFQGTACYELKVVSKSGMESQHYFAIDTGLLVGIKMTSHSPMGAIPTTTTIKEYREFDGLKTAAVTEQSMMGMTQIMTVESISFDPIDDAVFALPAEIKALVDK